MERLVRAIDVLVERRNVIYESLSKMSGEYIFIDTNAFYCRACVLQHRAGYYSTVW